jgi:tetratricopeptide (TPR) repeat protein
MRSAKRLLFLSPLLAVLVAADPRADLSPDDLIRAGNAAAARGEFEKAEEWYAAAEERTADPGLVAFNTGNALFHRERFADAERHFTRALDDADAPPARRAAALYNRGVCLLKQGGLQKLRAAIDSFDRCLALPPDDTALIADAKHNLELAKLLWAEARAKEAKKPLPNDPPPDTPPDPRPERPTPQSLDPFGQQDQLTPDRGQQAGGMPEPIRGGANGGNPRATDEQTAGKGNVTTLGQQDRLPDLTPAQVRQYLEELAQRVANDRRTAAALTAPPERPSVKDW